MFFSGVHILRQTLSRVGRGSFRQLRTRFGSQRGGGRGWSSQSDAKETELARAEAKRGIPGLITGFIFGTAFGYYVAKKLQDSREEELLNNSAASNSGGSKFRPLVVVGPSGVGKGTLLRMLFEEFPDSFSFCVSNTTRKPREGEVHGKNYFFTEKAQMERDIAADLFVEHATFAGNTYGTSRAALAMVAATGRVPVLELDTQGAMQLESKKMDAVFTFVKPPSFQALEKRLRKRGTESEASIQRRTARAKKELEYIDSDAASYFQVVVVNDELDASYARLRQEILDYYPHIKNSAGTW